MVEGNLMLLKKFGESIKSMRHSNGISQLKLSQLVGCSLQTLGSIERGVSNPSLIMVYRIAKALNINAKDLIP